ncbi:MAG TPA: HAMP domain-containing sensor histidine kinase [Sunxiuqinia sp.]|nr:HAMP domain-containing sensor histidine kinase [Sunxiuqinia sp.]
MGRTIAKISLVLLIIVALPISFYLVREFSALSKNELMVQRVFSTQLESILYSVNQYSENVVKQWSQSLDQPVDPSGNVMQGLVYNIFQNNQSVLAIRFLQLQSNQVEAAFFNHNYQLDNWPPMNQLKRLQDYFKSNYQRIETKTVNDSTLMFYFLTKNRHGEQVCQLMINPKEFVLQTMSPQIQQIAQNLFFISVSDSLSGNTIYSTEENSGLSEATEKAQMWYLPAYKLGIRLKAKTVEELATERTQRDNFTLLGLSIVVILGLLFVIWNIRKEMKLAELKSEFVSNVSHEIRTPLALISMYSETLLMKRLKTEEKQQEYLNTIQQESARLTDIVNRILNFSRLEKNRIKYRFENIDLAQLVPEMLATLKSHLKAAQVDCQFNSEVDEALAYADSEVVKTMLVNLVDNAIKYGADQNKKIDIRLLKKQKAIWVEVEDNGIGIAPKNQKHVFDQFYRVTEGDLAHKAKGSGLGLNLVKRMMKAHGGSVSLRSRLGEGSTFILKFPVKKQ